MDQVVDSMASDRDRFIPRGFEWWTFFNAFHFYITWGSIMAALTGFNVIPPLLTCVLRMLMMRGFESAIAWAEFSLIAILYRGIFI